MAKNWEIFETEACKFLNNNIRIKGIKFSNTGMSNSVNSDIAVIANKNHLFNIEAKFSPSQSGQIVVLFENGRYVYSQKSKEPKNDFVTKIIQHLNNNLEKYKDCGTAAIKLKVDNNTLVRWIEEHYKRKNVKFVITSDTSRDFQSSFIKVIRLDNMHLNFNIIANLRRKRSGTTKIPSIDFALVASLLKKKFGNRFKLEKSGKLKVKGKIDDYYLSDRFFISEKNGLLTIKKRSQTNNVNIIFSLKYIGKKETTGFDVLRKEINNLID